MPEETPVNSSKRPVTIIVLGKYREVFSGFESSVRRYLADYPVVFVRDGHEIPYPLGWTLVQGPPKFSMGGNANLGVVAAEPDSDLLYCGDDVRFLDSTTIDKLQEIAYKDETIGILSPKIIGRGSPTQINADLEITFCKPLEMWFPCVYIKRELIKKVGVFDEQFNDFGCDDLDYCIRTLLAGYSLAVTNAVTVQHEASPEGGPTTFVKNIGVDVWQQQQAQAQRKLADKYKVSMSTLGEFFQTGNLNLLSPQAPAISKSEEQQRAEAKEKLKSRSLYVATPAYGGMLTVNYATSLIGLINLCQNLGIKYTTSFIYNESLITRARNKMVSDFMQKSDCTDFVFIDADIGFDPRDVLMLLAYDEGIIGCPCVRKNLRLDRVADAAVKASQSNQKLSIDDLEKLCGEYVVNFPADSTTKRLHLDKLTEVQDVGTGLMRVRREIFEKVQAEPKFKDRWYVPMVGEDADPAVPMFMFFQSCIDPDSAKFNATGYPHYIAEDYAFCRLCASIGIKTYLAPWMKTTHLGSYLFRGDLLAVSQAGGRLR